MKVEKVAKMEATMTKKKYFPFREREGYLFIYYFLKIYIYIYICIYICIYIYIYI